MRRAASLLFSASIVLGACHRPTPVAVPADARPIVNVARIAGRPPAAVDSVLGAPIRDPLGYHDLVWYGDGISIHYRGGRADWIQANALGHYRFGPEVLRLFGITSPPPPTSATRSSLRWDGSIPPFAVVTLHTHARLRGGTDYVNFYVTGTPPDSVF